MEYEVTSRVSYIQIVNISLSAFVVVVELSGITVCVHACKQRIGIFLVSENNIEQTSDIAGR